MKRDLKLLNGKVLTISYFDDGEGITIHHSICAEKFKKFLEENIVEDVDVLFEDKADNLEMKIFLQSKEEVRESEILGTMWGEGCSRKVAENIVDGIEMTREEYEKLNDED